MNTTANEPAPIAPPPRAARAASCTPTAFEKTVGTLPDLPWLLGFLAAAAVVLGAVLTGW
ncbi:hypothetical protein ABT247_08165 [Kitasatospora sp. NPDC001539]|uniref:hypothetical protein n=1 Tax=Kitasatospora sp. NPDC001539 TaxID=3154384 RepID=UPI00331C6B66